jgi:hypothetical protein
VTTKAEEYRAKAQECEERAAQTRDSFIKEQLLEVVKRVAADGRPRREAIAVAHGVAPEWAK